MNKLNSLWTAEHPRPAAWDMLNYEEKKQAIRRQKALALTQEVVHSNENAHNDQTSSTRNGQTAAGTEQPSAVSQNASTSDRKSAQTDKQVPTAKLNNKRLPLISKLEPPAAKPMSVPSRTSSNSPTSSEYLSARSPSDIKDNGSHDVTSPSATINIRKPLEKLQIRKHEHVPIEAPKKLQPDSRPKASEPVRNATARGDTAAVRNNTASVYSDRQSTKQRTGTIVPRSVLGKRKPAEQVTGSSQPPSVRPSASSSAATPNTNQVVHLDPLPDWYRQVRMPKPGRAGNRDVLGVLQEIRFLIQKLDKPSAVGEEREQLWRDIRKQVHKVAHQNVDEVLVKWSKLMERSAHGLPQLFVARYGGKFEDCPYDISADAREVFLKWCRNDFDPDILRGINCATKILTVKSNFPKLCAPDEYGEGDLVSGQWWPRRVCVNRDGAHGPPVAGIYGKKGKGAMSVIMSHGNYHDIDNGDIIQYCGTEGDPTHITADTQLLRTSYHTGKPVRVMRTERLSETNVYRPKRGVRYDGLYQVTGEELIKPETSHYRFRMERLPNQDPIRYKGPEARPYTQEVEAYDSHIDLMRGSE